MKVSVIVPVHDTERYVPEAVEKTLAQTRRDFDLVILNDGSTDTSPEILRRSGHYRIFTPRSRRNRST